MRSKADRLRGFKPTPPPYGMIAPFVRKSRARRTADAGRARADASASRAPTFFDHLASFTTDRADITALLHESAAVLQRTARADSAHVYLVDTSANQIYESVRQERFVAGGNIQRAKGQRMEIDTGTSVQAHVAFRKEHVALDSYADDKRFPKGIGAWDESRDISGDKAVLCVPIVTPEGNLFAVLMFLKQPFEPFAKDHLKIAIVVTGWMGAAIHQNLQRLAMCRQQKMNDELLELIKQYFEESIDTSRLITEIVKYTKDAIGAHKGNFFVMDKESDELVADLYEEGIDSGDPGLFKKNVAVKMARDRGIASLAARNGVTIRVNDLTSDPRLVREAKNMARRGFELRTILCTPIAGVNSIVGLLQVFNKSSGIFTRADEGLARTFAFYSSCALQQHALAKRLRAVERAGAVTSAALDRQISACRHDADHFVRNLNIKLPKLFFEYRWYIGDNMKNDMPQLVFYMIREMCHDGDVILENLMRFALTVRKLYRNNPYHNFEHAFNVCHCMFCILRKNKDYFTSLEIKALMIATLCHDIDHGGYNNNFLVITDDVISQLYEESQWENYHYFVTAHLLQQFELFKSLSARNYDRLLKEIKEAILATDLQVYFKNRLKLLNIMNAETFAFDNAAHRALLKTIMMTACDLSGQCKPFSVARKICESVYREFYNQGDREKQLGFAPLSMMDRDRKQMIPEDQIEFIAVVVAPVLEMLKKLMPNTADLLGECLALKKTWQEIAQLKETKGINQDEMFGTAKKK